MKISFLKAIFSPFGIIGNNLSNFLKIGSIGALTLTILGYSLGSTYACLYSPESHNLFYCSGLAGWGFWLFQLLKFFTFSIFIKIWTNVVFENKKINFAITKQNIKILGAIVLIALACTLPLFSIYFLYTRVPNPNWKIELIYFSFCSLGFIVPFLSIRLIPFLGFLSLNLPTPKVKEIWQQTKINFFKILTFILTLLILFVFLLANFNQNFTTIQDNLNLANVIFTDFIYNLTLLLILAIFINHCIILTDFIKGEEKQ